MFRIFARNKQLHSPIRAYDDIMLYFVAGRKWVSAYGLANAVAKPNPCPGLTLSPSPQKYDINFIRAKSSASTNSIDMQ